MLLSDLVETNGWELILYKRPHEHPDALGDPSDDSLCAALEGRRIAATSDDMEHVYSAAHEIAEAETGFKGHTQFMWITQANILADWCLLLSRRGQ